MFNRSIDPIVVFYDPSTKFAIVKDYLYSRSIYVRPRATGSKRLTSIVENLNRIIRRCIKKSTLYDIDKNGYPVNRLD
jgi:hypothetical protein